MGSCSVFLFVLQYLNRGCTRFFATKDTDKQILQNRKSPEVGTSDHWPVHERVLYSGFRQDRAGEVDRGRWPLSLLQSEPDASERQQQLLSADVFLCCRALEPRHPPEQEPAFLAV